MNENQLNYQKQQLKIQIIKRIDNNYFIMSRILKNSSTEKMSQLSEKINGIFVCTDNEKEQKINDYERKVRIMEDHFEEIQSTFNKSYNQIRDQIAKIQRIIDDEKNHRELVLETKLHEIIEIDRKLELAISTEAEGRDESFNKIKNYVDDRFETIRNELSKEVRIRNEQLDNLQACIEGDLPKLVEAMKATTMEREDGDEALSKKLALEINKVKTLVNQEKRIREESEQSTYDNLREVVSKVKVDIDSERRNREDTEETILTLLEETCTKLVASSKEQRKK